MVNGVIAQQDALARQYRMIVSIPGYSGYHMYHHCLLHDVGGIIKLLSCLEFRFQQYQTVSIKRFGRIVVNADVLVSVVLLVSFRI